MRPLLPQSKFNFPVLLKLVGVYGFIALIVLLCVDVFLYADFGGFWRNYKILGIAGVIERFNYYFGGWDSGFLRGIRRMPPLILFIPFGVGGIFGVMHYIFVRRRRSMIVDMGESSAVDDGDGCAKIFENKNEH